MVLARFNSSTNLVINRHFRLVQTICKPKDIWYLGCWLLFKKTMNVNMIYTQCGIN